MEAWQRLRAAGSARVFFAAVRRAVTEEDEWRTIASYGADAFAPSGSGSAWVSDPTGLRAAYLADNDDAIRGHALAMVGECRAVVKAGEHIVAVVRSGLGGPYADALAMHYVDCLSFAQVAEMCGCSKSAAMLRRDVACDWVDSQPLSAFKGG